MRLRKRHRSAYTHARRDDDPSDADGAQKSEAPSLKGFRTLPIELQSIVIELACLSPPTSEVFMPDYSTATSLSLASKSLNRIVQPLLLSHIIITRPSALYSLGENLAARTMSHELIKYIHIGPLEPLPADWWPLANTDFAGQGWRSDLDRFIWFKTSLNRAALPEGYEDKQAWALDRRSIGCREAAIHDALDAAQGYYRIDLRSEALSESSTRVEAVLEVQAALDLYLQEVRRLEEEQEPELKKVARPGGRVPLQCRTGRCSHYPALLIHDAPHENYRPWVYEGKRFVIRRAQILCHLARKGATADRFDHPLALARAGFQVTVTPRPAQSDEKHASGAARYVISSETWNIKEEHEAHEWSEAKLLESAITNQRWWGNCQPTAGVLLNTGSFASTVQTVRSLVQPLPNLQNLSLTGSLEQIFDGSLQMSSLKRLSLGPHPGQWKMQTSLDGLPGLQRLRIAGVPLVEDVIRSIVTKMPKLEEFEWCLAEKFSRRHELSFPETFELLLLSGADPPPSANSTPAEEVDNEVAGQARASFSDPLIIAKLHPTDVLEILTIAKRKEIQDAWREGKRLDESDVRRLRVEECKAVASTRLSKDSASEAWGKMYEDGRRWWRELW